MNSNVKKVLKNEKIEPIVLKLLYWFCVFMYTFFPKYTIKHYYKRLTGKNIDIDNPKTYNEKIQRKI